MIAIDIIYFQLFFSPICVDNTFFHQFTYFRTVLYIILSPFIYALNVFRLCRVFLDQIEQLQKYYMYNTKVTTKHWEFLASQLCYVSRWNMVFEDPYYTINKPFLKALGIWPHDTSRIATLQRVLTLLVLVPHIAMQVINHWHYKEIIQ